MFISRLDVTIVFTGQGVDWVREVHRHTSITKAGQSRVMFRSSNNDKVNIINIDDDDHYDDDKVETRDELRTLLQETGHSTEGLDRSRLIS